MPDKDKAPSLSKRAGCGPIYLTITEVVGGKPIVSLKGGKGGTCMAAQLSAIGTALTLAFRSGVSVEDMASSFEDVSCPQSMAATGGPSSCADAVSKLLKSYAKEK